MSNEEVANYINYEGLGYAIDCGMSYKSIEDKKLAEEWRKAEEDICNIKTILGGLLEE